MTGRVVVSPSHIAALAPSALPLAAVEGARVVSLHWLYQLMAARVAWAESAGACGGSPRDDATGESDAGDHDEAAALHRARVALRRLRATLREHRRLLELEQYNTYLSALRKLNAASNALRDRDVRAEWLETQDAKLPADARAEASAWQHRLVVASPEHERQRLSRAFARHLDAHALELARTLGEYQSRHVVGEDHRAQRFALRVADRLAKGRRRIDGALAQYGTSSSDRQLHRLRLQFKRMRALLAPHVDEHKALHRCYELLTHGQDALGGMRDATLFAAQADRMQSAALARVLRAEAEGQMARFAQTWLTHSERRSTIWEAAIAALRDDTPLREAVAPHSAPFDAAAVALAHQLPMEIERKFLLHGLPPRAAVAPSLRIEQGWLPGTLLRERLRQSVSMTGDVQRTRTIKLGRPGARIEVEEPVGAELFDALWPLTSAARIHKRRHLVVEGALTWEIDVFLDRDLVLAEVELQDTAQEVPIPEWLAPFLVREVTDDPAYLNAVMAQRHVGAPEDARS